MAREIDEIKDAAGAYRKWALEARKKYIELRLRQDPEIRSLYIRAADRVAKELRKLALKTPSSYLRKRQLEELEVALRVEADRLTGNLTKAFEQYIEQAVDAGGGYSQAIALDLFKKAGMDIAGLRTMFATVNRQAVEACWARTKKGLFLSDRIWKQGETFRNTMRDLVQEAVATGQDAVKTARILQQYVRQGAQTLAKDYPNMMKRMKGRIPGDISYEALRLARTEMTAAFGEGTIAAARVSPSYIGMKWVLSHSHPLTDICDDLAAHDEGLGRGVYSPGDEPPLPAHPNCICTLVPVHEEPEKFVERLKKWRDDPDNDKGLENWYNSIYKAPHERPYNFVGGIKRPPKIREYAEGYKIVSPADLDKSKQLLSPADVNKVFKRLPKKLRRLVSEIQILDYRNPADAHWEKVYNMPGFRSFATGGKGQVHFYENAHIPKQTIIENLFYSLSHEVGHNLDQALGRSTLSAGKRFSESINWMRAIDKDGRGMVSQYAQKANSPVEDFADSISYFIMNKQEFTKTFPNRAKILKEVLK